MNQQELLDNCVFCRIAQGRTPASIVAESAEALAFMDINQPTPGHVLIIPRAHLKDIYEVGDGTAASLFQLTVRVAKAVKVALHPDGLDLLQANERAGQQHVFHFHIHIVARYEGDRDRIWQGWQSNLPDHGELEQLAARISSAL
jgi:histidine triad (HIT) family protein